MRRVPAAPYDGPTTLAIDVSHHQGEIDWGAVARSEAILGLDLDPDRARKGSLQGPVRLAIVRTGDGKDADRRARENLQGAHGAGIPVGVYHYLRADRGAGTQIEVMREVLAVAGARPAFAAIDIESGAAANLPGGVVSGPRREALPPELVAVEALELLRRVETQLRIPAAVYTGQAFHWWWSQPRPATAARFARYPLWLADYRRRPHLPAHGTEPHPWPAWTLWQYTSEGRIRGIRGPVDLNVFRGDEAELERWLAAGPNDTTGPVTVDPLTIARERVLAAAADLKRTHPRRAEALVGAAKDALTP